MTARSHRLPWARPFAAAVGVAAGRWRLDGGLDAAVPDAIAGWLRSASPR